MAYINPKTDYKDGQILYGDDLNASNEVIKAGVDDNFDRIKALDITATDTEERVTILEEGIGEHEQRLNNIDTEIEAHEGRINNLEGASEEDKRDIQNLDNRTTALEEDNDTNKNNIKDLLNGETPIATKNDRGFVKVGANLEIEEDGTLNAKNPYVLPIANETTIGGVSIGKNIDVTESGNISTKGVKGVGGINVVVQDGDYYISYEGGTLSRKIVDELPEIGEEGYIYLVPKNPEEKDIYNEYLWINNQWELMGSTSADLDDYYKKDEIDEKLEDKADRTDIVKEVFVSETQPSEPSMIIWIDESEEATAFDPDTVYTKEEIDNKDFLDSATYEDKKSDYVKDGLVNNTNVLTDEEKLKIEGWLGLDENYLTYYNATPYQVNGDYIPAHKKYVDSKIGDIDTILQDIDVGGGV